MRDEDVVIEGDFEWREYEKESKRIQDNSYRTLSKNTHYNAVV